MLAGVYDFCIDQGATLVKTFVWKDANGAPINLNGYSARCQMRQSVHDDTVADSLTTANGRISIDGPAGAITLTWPAAVTTTFVHKRYVYDLELELAGVVTRLLQGCIAVSPEVTR